jgi:hypothetical protein
LFFRRPSVDTKVKLDHELSHNRSDRPLTAGLKHDRVERALCDPGKPESERRFPTARFAADQCKLPQDAPTDFLPQRLKPIVINQGEIDRRAWECALLLQLRDELKAGNLSVRYSKRFARLEEFFIDDRRWQSMREDFFHRSGLPSDTKQVPEYLACRLGEAYERFLKTAPSNSYAMVDEDGWRLSAEPTEKLDQEEQDRLAHLKSWLAKHMRHVKLPDLLIEVDNQLGFTRNFLTPAQRQA